SFFTLHSDCSFYFVKFIKLNQFTNIDEKKKQSVLSASIIQTFVYSFDGCPLLRDATLELGIYLFHQQLPFVFYPGKNACLKSFFLAHLIDACLLLMRVDQPNLSLFLFHHLSDPLQRSGIL